MVQKIPPAPVGSIPGSSYWNDWYERIRNLINSGTISQLWSSIDFTASNITDIVTRNHNNLQSMQGGTAGEYYHLTAAEYAALGGGGGGTVTEGSATLDFGASPGSSEASITITGQAGILVTSNCRAFILGDATSADHTASDHKYAAALIGLTTGNIVAGTGFTIYGRCLDKLEGEFTINWEWV